MGTQTRSLFSPNLAGGLTTPIMAYNPFNYKRYLGCGEVQSRIMVGDMRRQPLLWTMVLPGVPGPVAQPRLLLPHNCCRRRDGKRNGGGGAAVGYNDATDSTATSGPGRMARYLSTRGGMRHESRQAKKWSCIDRRKPYRADGSGTSVLKADFRLKNPSGKRA